MTHQTIYMHESAHTFEVKRKPRKAIGYTIHKCTRCEIVARQYGMSEKVMIVDNISEKQAKYCI